MEPANIYNYIQNSGIWKSFNSESNYVIMRKLGFHINARNLVFIVILTVLTAFSVFAIADNRIQQEYEVKGEKLSKTDEWPEAPAPGARWRVVWCVDDFDGDGKDEIIISRGTLTAPLQWSSYYVDHNGELIKILGTYSSTLCLDFDRDGIREFLGIDLDGNLHIISLKKDGYHKTYKGIAGVEKVIDLNGDGVKDFIALIPLDMKVVQSRYGGPLHYYVSINLIAYDGLTGKPIFNVTVTNDPKETFEYSYFKHLSSDIRRYGLITVEDLDGDNRPEILVGLTRNYWEDTLWYNVREYVLRCFSSDGKLIWTKIESASSNIPYVYIIKINGSKFILFEDFPLRYVTLLSANGETLWAKKAFYGELLDASVPLVEGGLVFIDWDTIRFVDPSNGFVKREIKLPSRAIEAKFVNLQGKPFIVIGTEKGLYVLNTYGDVVADVIFNTATRFNLMDSKGAVIYFYSNKSVYFMDFIRFNVSKLFDSIISGSVIPANLDDDVDTEFLVVGSYLQAYESNGTPIWSYGVGGYILGGKPGDLDGDSIVDAVFLEGDFEHSVLIFKNGRVIYELDDCVFADLNGDGFLEAITVGPRGLEVYDRVGNVVWSIKEAYRKVDAIPTSKGETIIAVASYQVRLYSAYGELLKVVGSYKVPPSIKFVKSAVTGKAYLVVLSRQGESKYNLEVYDEEGALVLTRLVEGLSVKDAKFFDVDGDQQEELVVPPYVFKLSGELVSNEYRESEKRWILDINDDGVSEYVEIDYSRKIISFKDSHDKVVATIQLPSMHAYPFKSGEKEISIYIINLTQYGYYLIPLKYYYLHIESPYKVPGEGLYPAGSTVTISAPTIVELRNLTRIVFVGWSGDVVSDNSSVTFIMNSPKTIVAQWKTQYYLEVVSPIGEVRGGGWYDAGSKAEISVTTPVIGSLIRQIFTGWSGDVVENDTRVTVVMDRPKRVYARWKTDYTYLYYLFIPAVAIITSSLTVVKLKNSKHHIPSESPPEELCLEHQGGFIRLGGYTIVGRSNFDWLPDEVRGKIEEEHLAVYYRKGEWWVEDLGSRHGTYVNGVRVKKVRIGEGDVISPSAVVVLKVGKCGSVRMVRPMTEEDATEVFGGRMST